jgi:hypothetical protein
VYPDRDTSATVTDPSGVRQAPHLRRSKYATTSAGESDSAIVAVNASALSGPNDHDQEHRPLESR